MADQFDHVTTALAEFYTIEREAGAGDMATVYLARHLKHEQNVVVRTGFLERTLDEQDHAIGRAGRLGADRWKNRVLNEEWQ
jgi:hypothetical protein